MIPGTEINTIERCSGHAGTYGVKKASHETAMKIGKPVFKAMAAMKDGSKPDYISSDCAMAARHIQQGMDESDAGGSTAQKQHPLTLLRIAYAFEQATHIRRLPPTVPALDASCQP